MQVGNSPEADEAAEAAEVSAPYLRPLIGETSAFPRLTHLEPLPASAQPGPHSLPAKHGKRVQLPPERVSVSRLPPWKEKVLRALKYRVSFCL